MYPPRDGGVFFLRLRCSEPGVGAAIGDPEKPEGTAERRKAG